MFPQDAPLGSPSHPPAKLLDQVRDKLRTLHYSCRTENQYVHWIRRNILFHRKRHPAEMNAHEVEAFLTHLAVDRRVSAGTQNQALSALLLLYQKVLGSSCRGSRVSCVRSSRCTCRWC
jgi:hypothetical protein